MRSLLIIASLISGGALASSWGAFQNIFPEFPCPDGWAGCEINGQTIDIGSVQDDKGRYYPADFRVDFFDFTPLPSFSPFVSLTVYPEEYASLEVEEPSEPEAIPEPRVVTQKVEKEPVKRALEPVFKPVAEPVAEPEVVPEPVAEPVAEPEAVPEPVVEPIPEPEAVTTVVEDPGCDNLIALEGPAMMGQLNPMQKRCLEGRIGSDEALTLKRKVSLVLINNAQAKGDQGAWERLVKRHLENLDQSDPNLCLSYSIHLFKKGDAFARQVIRWSDKALENKTQFSKGSDYQKKLYMLYKLKTVSAQRLWLKSESQKKDADIKKYKGMTKNFSREWLDYARASGQSIKEPLSICVSAADKSFCDG